MVKRVIIYRVDEEGMSLDCEICGLDGCELEREREREMMMHINIW